MVKKIFNPRDLIIFRNFFLKASRFLVNILGNFQLLQACVCMETLSKFFMMKHNFTLYIFRLGHGVH